MRTVISFSKYFKRARTNELAGIAAKGFKEATYHLRHSKEWMLRLGDGTEESHRRLQSSVDDLWPFTNELFAFDETERVH